jgi:hypothetical protein
MGGAADEREGVVVPRNDQIVRILSVARALAASRRGVSLRALAEREGWHWRTVYRDRDALQAAGFLIEEPSPGRFKMAEGWAVRRPREADPYDRLFGWMEDRPLHLVPLESTAGARHHPSCPSAREFGCSRRAHSSGARNIRGIFVGDSPERSGRIR